MPQVEWDEKENEEEKHREKIKKWKRMAIKEREETLAIMLRKVESKCPKERERA
jgi:hypothetical protein